MKTLLASILLASMFALSAPVAVAAEGWFGSAALIQVRDKGHAREHRRADRRHAREHDRRRYRRNRGWSRGWGRGWGPPPRRYYGRDCDASIGPFCINL